MKKWMTMIAFGGLLSTTGFVETTSTEVAQAPATSTDSDTAPCPWCCPVHICGMNGPSFDGTTADAECSAK